MVRVHLSPRVESPRSRGNAHLSPLVDSPRSRGNVHLSPLPTMHFAAELLSRVQARYTVKFHNVYESELSTHYKIRLCEGPPFGSFVP